MRTCLYLVAMLLIGESAAMGADRAAVTPQEAHDWLLHVIPLPKEAAIEAKVTVPVSAISIVVRRNAAPLEAAEAEKLAAELREHGAPEAMPPSARAQFAILVGVLDATGMLEGRKVAGAERLRGLPNRDQAYVIEPAGDAALLVAALDAKGVYYGTKTLRQLMSATFGQGPDGWTVQIPLARVLDWPDLAERGEWGGSVSRDIESLADRKMNLCEAHCSSLKVTDDGRGVAEFDKTLIERGAKCAAKVVPIITHLDQLEGTGLFRVLPRTLGVGDPSKWPYGGTTVKPACFSKPETARVLGEWMVSLAEQPEVTDICIWLSEHHVACECDECRRKGQFVLEAEAIARGYALAKQARPDIRLRVLLTQGSYDFNDQVIAALPRDIGITYYDGGRTYDSSRNPMIYPLLERYAAGGAWLGCYPQLTASWRIVCPWSGPQFIRFRMTEFADKKLQCLCGYATPDNRFYDLNVNAAAEWSWNAHGRDEREFALAYFTRRGVPDPARAADWAVTLGPVGWDVYGARVPYSWFFGATAQRLAHGNLPALGDGPYAYMPTEDHIRQDLGACAAAMKLAKDVGDPALITETQVIDGYVKMLSTIHQMAAAIGAKTELTDAEKQTVTRLMAELDQATSQTTEGLRAWGQAVAPDSTAGRFDDTVQVTEQTCADIGKALARFGIDDPGRPYRMNKVGEWRTEDFAEGPRITKQWEVTESLGGPGTYHLAFVYGSGWYGLTIYTASLVSAPKDAPDQFAPVAKDEHPGTAAYTNVANVYQFDVREQDPNRRYFIIADIGGMPKDSPPEHQGCNGELIFWKQRPE